MDDFAACADLCDHHGFPAPAAALRALARGTPPFYLVRAIMEPEIADEYGLDFADIYPLDRKIFRDHAAANRYTSTLTARVLRNYVSRFGPPTELSSEEFVREVGMILGGAYELPDGGEKLFPKSATDEQLGRIGLLLEFTLFDVAEFSGVPARQGRPPY